MATTGTRTMRFAGRRYPLVLPNRADPRLHVAAVIISTHVVGITALGFRVSVPQILSAIAVAGLIEVAFTFRKSGALVWPASGFLTGSGVALILRITGMPAGHYWSWRGWHYFALIAGFSVLTKYVVRRRGTHVFNPSNLGLVIAFLVLGSSVVEPLDFWWAPFGLWMAVAYLVIVGGGALITARLGLLAMAATFWLTFTAGLGLLAASGHCMIATWSLTPVCGSRFWWTLAVSPEVLIFLFFMLTDPKTIPRGRSARAAFAATAGLVATLLIAPHGVEFGAKVGLLGSLVVLTPFRGIFDRLPALAGDVRPAARLFVRRLRARGPKAALRTGALAGVAMTIAAAGIVVAGAPAREPADAVFAAPAGPVADVIVEVDRSTLPTVAIDPSVDGVDAEVDDARAAALAVNLAENLRIEAEACLRADKSLLAAADAGNRLAQMNAWIDDTSAAGKRVVREYSFESLVLRVVAGAGQARPALGFDGDGTLEQITYDHAGVEQHRTELSFRSTFVIRPLGEERWKIVDVLPQES